ncbi:MAG: polyphosphate kinase 1, partial [Candidatus Sumerlaeaceae bacterium]|nr:polyphosphate kinase 1 [Candidatus Sumerlaeaceae bacterium]
MTLYRTSPESPIMRSLIKAANNGKQVVALVELKARFDEANNIQWARLLEREGVHVVYGIVGYKTHCKACLVVRREGKQLRRYCHLATGNYNPTTAAIYTDLCLFTAEPAMGDDVADLFNMLTGFSSHAKWKRIVLSPNAMHARLIKLIKTEAAIAARGGNGRIICKMNSLVDPEIIVTLYEASRAGVKIDLIVRGICCLRPGIPGISDNIRVVSVVGRFLEHSRVFYFSQNGKPQIFLSSADWMQRNFFSRIEMMFAVDDLDLRERILNEILGAALSDNLNSWELKNDGSWKRRSASPPNPGFDSHKHLIAIEQGLAAATTELPV